MRARPGCSAGLDEAAASSAALGLHVHAAVEAAGEEADVEVQFLVLAVMAAPIIVAATIIAVFTRLTAIVAALFATVLALVRGLLIEGFYAAHRALGLIALRFIATLALV